MRVLFVVLGCSGLDLVMYLVLWIVVPEEPQGAASLVPPNPST
jgi:phage shock protein PspC (stress-responsive transcriptional regulator)